MVGDCTAAREIVIRRRNNNLQFIADTHRSYDALQYPLIFWKGQDGYCINIKQRDTVSGAETNKNVSSKDYYAYRLMIRRGLDNVILRCRELCQQFMVDMYAKIESERLRYLRYNQQKLRAEEYIHLRDAINNNADVAEIGNHVILPSSYVGSPRHMQEYIQDALTFVREYGRPCLFITFTCNPKWPEITSLLLPGQNAIHRHDITARVQTKLKSLISFITKSHVFGPTRCWMYSVEWQKRGLPHAHILVWFIDKIRPEEIDSIISAEIPDPSTDQLLFDIVTTNMIHGPCGTFNSSSPCMADGKCTKISLKILPMIRSQMSTDTQYIVEEILKMADNHLLKISSTQTLILTIVVVPYSPLLSKTYNAHINVEFCSSVKSIKYICNSNEAAWRIFGFPSNERDPAVVQLAIHLENARAQILWENHKDSMTDDILHQHRIRCHDLTITFSDEMYNEALIAIEDLCIVIANLPLSNFGMNSPNRTASDLMNTEMNRELQYSTVEMAAIVARNVPLMNEEQRTIYDRIMLAVSAGQDIGDGKVAIDETGYVKLPTDFCTIADSQDTLIEQIFPDVHTQYINHEWLAERAILAAKNVDVDNLNLKIQMLLPGNLVSYKSIDTVCDDSEAVNFPTEF
ncbi:hypothetical protein EVAR_91879_1 [Eumeta japonica]|uniref:Helitron helicase-like domain-containing protein n=1 Tax=Eumeta variegata TaxID=151549 RepID=A0A4C1SNH3_EUMVA|nr:hypothetical protein EVAR_91879_1 [Eumeta japonica]